MEARHELLSGLIEEIIAEIIEKNRKTMQSSVTANMGSQGESSI